MFKFFLNNKQRATGLARLSRYVPTCVSPQKKDFT